MKRNYWYYSGGLAIAWAIVFIVVLILRGPAALPDYGRVFGGYCLGWISTTIARFVYPPPKRWKSEGYGA